MDNGWTALNTDGCFNERKKHAGAGGSLRDHDRNWLVVSQLNSVIAPVMKPNYGVSYMSSGLHGRKTIVWSVLNFTLPTSFNG